MKTLERLLDETDGYKFIKLKDGFIDLEHEFAHSPHGPILKKPALLYGSNYHSRNGAFILPLENLEKLQDSYFPYLPHKLDKRTEARETAFGGLYVKRVDSFSILPKLKRNKDKFLKKTARFSRGDYKIIKEYI